LHHIPRVSYAIQEMVRVLKSEGYLILNEPTISMGDWRERRSGLTPRERGVPFHLLRRFVRDQGLEVIREARCMFAPLVKMSTLVWRAAYNSHSYVILDWLLSRLPFWSMRYHSESLVHKFRPVSAFLVLRKP